LKVKQLLIFVFFLNLFTGNTQVDSLIRILPNLKGDQKIFALCDLSFYLSGSDPTRGMYYGRLALQESKKNKNKKLILQSLNDMSISFLNASKYDTVLILAKEAVKVASELKDDISRAKAYNRIAMVYFERGAHKESIEFNFKALKIFEQYSQTQYQGLILTNIGASYEKLGLLNEALETHLKVLDLAKKTNSSEMFSSAYGNLGVVYMKKGEYRIADQYYSKALIYIDQNMDKKRLSILFQNVGVNARSFGNSQKGIMYYKKALELYKETKDLVGIGYIYLNLANCLLDVKELKDASSYIDSGFVIAKQLSSLPLIRDSYRALSRIETLKGNFSKADNFFEEYEKYRDSILNLEKVKAVSEIQTKYNLQAKEKELLKEKVANEKIQKQLYAVGGLALSLALVLLVFWQKNKLKLRRKEIETLNKLTQERNRIARDLHDNLGAELTIVSSKIDTKIYKTEKESEKKELELISEITRNAAVVLRETVWSINTESIDVRALKDKLDDYIQRIAGDHKIDFQINIENPNNLLTPMIALNFYRIIQEAVSNIIKYAGANEVMISISDKSIHIVDNGIGFNTSSFIKGYGINNMETRAKEMNGDFLIESSEKGTKLIIQLL
jgi:signal transduction histidine kinase